MGPQPCPSRSRCVLRTIMPLATSVVLSAAAGAQTGPRIQHDGLRCVLAGEHLILEALVEPTPELTTVKAYFRANLYAQFYYVEMVSAGDVYRGVLPKPNPEVTGLHYYLEAIDSSFNSVRTAEYTPQVVTDETNCRERNPTPAAYLDGSGAITVGATASGPPIPGGFLSDGIAASIPIGGRIAAESGGSGLLVGGVAAATGAAIGVGVLATGEDDDSATTTSPPTGGATTSASTTSIPGGMTTVPPVESVTACFDTSPSPPMIGAGDSVRFDASCTEPAREQIQSYVWDFHDGRGEREGRVVNRRYPDPGTYGALLTVTTLSGEQDRFEVNVVVQENAAPPGGGGGTPGPPSTADVEIVAGESAPLVTHVFTIRNNGPLTANGVSFTTTMSGAFTGYSGSFTPGFSTCTFSGPSATATCSAPSMAPGASFTVRVTVTPTSPTTIVSNASVSSSSPPDTVANNNRSVSTSALKAPSEAPERTRVTSALELPPGDGSTQGRITFNGSRTDVTDNTGPSTHEVPGRSGENTVEAFVIANPTSEGVWRFDFRAAPGFVSGSFVVDTGQVLSREPNAIVFRVAPGVRRIGFRYRLE